MGFVGIVLSLIWDAVRPYFSGDDHTVDALPINCLGDWVDDSLISPNEQENSAHASSLGIGRPA